MNGFSTVEKLKELEQRATAGKWEGFVPRNRYGTITRDDGKFISDLRNAAPLLLDIAGQIRPEDAKIFEVLIALYKGIGCSEDSVVIEVLKRYQRMAERMHEG